MKLYGRLAIKQRNKALWAIYVRNNNRKWRLAVVAALGGKCVKCGFSDERALQIDHVHGGGTREVMTGKRNGKVSNRKGDISTYYRLVISKIPSGKYQLLCANCNWIKRSENREIRGQFHDAPSDQLEILDG